MSKEKLELNNQELEWWSVEWWSVNNLIDEAWKKIWDSLVSDEIEKILITPLILAIDDEPEILNFIKKALKLKEYEVITAWSWDEWLRKYKEMVDKINLVILDLTMHGITWKAVLEKMIEINTKVDVIIISWYSFEEIPWWLEHARLFLEKPFSLDELFGAVDIVMEK